MFWVRGPSSAHRQNLCQGIDVQLRRKPEEGARQDDKAGPERGGGRQIRTTTQERPYESSLFERCGRENLPNQKRSGRTCQARGGKSDLSTTKWGSTPRDGHSDSIFRHLLAPFSDHPSPDSITA